MTVQDTRATPRPIAVALALVLMATLWLPTVSTPAPDAVRSGQSVAAVAASGAYAPVLM
ncbi:hypothetical protein SAMN05518801_101573 [Novosphingobium sp. CF614]|uniref:hypothetical protein n=1 Tax=Novosphingobium sp. CF614 TaxID=1884364 RepID=UPI0008EF0B57|nr:hypothetical protein [Novosphingobium sp. CF614]SFF79477.1 hypothetical protein SAMN05518801_101573 [Novosphingobium sp. CF614]